MTTIRRVTHLVAIAALFALGAMLVLDATGVIGVQWRDDGAGIFRDAVRPDLSDWVLALIGGGLVIVGVVLLLAQVLPPHQGGRRMYEVHSLPEGDTHIRVRAVLRATRHAVEEIEHVTGASIRWTGTAVRVEMHVDDEANLTEVESAAREALGHPFWIDMGLADARVDILVVSDGDRRVPSKVK